MADFLWLPVVGFEGLYEVSSNGRVASLLGRNRRILRAGDSRGYRLVILRRGGMSHTRLVHRLVLEAFVGPRPEGMVARHLNGDPGDNRLENLAWGTQSENNYDKVRHGTHHNANKTHCPSGHEYRGDNIKWYKGFRFCRACHRISERRRREVSV